MNACLICERPTINTNDICYTCNQLRINAGVSTHPTLGRKWASTKPVENRKATTDKVKDHPHELYWKEKAKDLTNGIGIAQNNWQFIAEQWQGLYENAVADLARLRSDNHQLTKLVADLTDELGRRKGEGE